jgi:hypothetical protein
MMREYGCELDCTYTWDDYYEQYDVSECTYETPGDDTTPAVCVYESEWNSAAPEEIDSVADGSLGWAAYQMTLQFDLETEDYDLTCYGVEAWPAPDGVREYSNLYLEVTEDTEADDGSLTVIDVPYHTSYSFFQEGDYKRAAMDAAEPDVAMATRRTSYTYAGKYCMYWDNWDGMNPQPWAENDCGLQALWLNDYYYECTYDSEYADYYACDLSGYAAYDDTYGLGCLDYDLETYECLEYACLEGEYLSYDDGAYTVEDFLIDGIQYYEGDYYCETFIDEYYSDAYNCDIYDYDTYTCLCYTTATYDIVDEVV